mgnify:CR=1 FL=1
MPRVFINCNINNIADKRRATFNKLKYQPLPSKRRAWKPINDNCPICLETRHLETNSLPDTRLTCFGKVQCNHTFHKECITPWLTSNRNCPICRDSGGFVGKMEKKNKEDIYMFSELSNDNIQIPYMMVIEAFFSKKHANLKINSISFIEQKKAHNESKKSSTKYNIHINMCKKKYCKNKGCKHAIVTTSEFIEWYFGIPDKLRPRYFTLKQVVNNVLLPALRAHAHHIYEHLVEISMNVQNLRSYEYIHIKANQN